MKHLKNERGVGLFFEILLGAVVLALAGFALYSYSQAKKAPVAMPQSTASSSPAATPDPTTKWTKYASSTGKFSVRYSPDWSAYTYNSYALSTCQKDAKDNMLNIDTVKSVNTVIGCGGGPVGQVHVSAIEGAKNISASFSADASLYTNVKNETVTVDGVEGIRYSATSLQNQVQIEKDGKVVEYHFYANGRNYSFIMEQHPGSADIIGDFDLMVRTLKFSS